MIIDLLYYSMGKSFDYTDYFGAYIFTANYTLACAGAIWPFLNDDFSIKMMNVYIKNDEFWH